MQSLSFAKKRLIEKQLSKAEPVFFAYNRYDRLLVIQYGNMRVNGDWMITKYDALKKSAIIRYEKILFHVKRYFYIYLR